MILSPNSLLNIFFISQACELFHQLENLFHVFVVLHVLDLRLYLFDLREDIGIFESIQFPDYQLVEFVFFLFQLPVFGVILAKLILFANRWRQGGSRSGRDGRGNTGLR